MFNYLRLTLLFLVIITIISLCFIRHSYLDLYALECKFYLKEINSSYCQALIVYVHENIVLKIGDNFFAYLLALGIIRLCGPLLSEPFYFSSLFIVALLSLNLYKNLQILKQRHLNHLIIIKKLLTLATTLLLPFMLMQRIDFYYNFNYIVFVLLTIQFALYISLISGVNIF